MKRLVIPGVLFCLLGGTLLAGTPPPGLQETIVVSSIFNLDGFDWTPNGERGLVGLTVDPDFALNQHLYFYCTALAPTVHNRVSRFTAVGDTLVNEQILLEGPTLGSIEHNSGGLRFGLDGKLYIAMGDNRSASSAQDLGSLLGKILRINPDGTIPSDNPFVVDPNARPEGLGLRVQESLQVQRAGRHRQPLHRRCGRVDVGGTRARHRRSRLRPPARRRTLSSRSGGCHLSDFLVQTQRTWGRDHPG